MLQTAPKKIHNGKKCFEKTSDQSYPDHHENLRSTLPPAAYYLQPAVKN